MNNGHFDFEHKEIDKSNFRDYLILIHNHLFTFITLLGLTSLAAIIFAITLPDIYISSTSIKVNKSSSNILETPSFGEMADISKDRFINNEIEILRSYNLRERVAISLLDSIRKTSNADIYKLLVTSEFGSKEKIVLDEPQIVKVLESNVDIEQKKGLDILVISAESPSAQEAALISDVYAKIYKIYNLEINRDQLSYVRNFLDQQRNEKRSQLREAEDTLRSFQERGGIIALNEQAQTLIQQVSQFEAQLNAARIELTASEEVLKKYKEELEKQDPKLADYLQSVTSEAYITALQNQISELQLNKDLALARVEPGIDISEKVKEYDAKIRELKAKLDDKIKILKGGIFASSPEEVRNLSQKIIEAEVKNQSLRSSIMSLSGIVRSYEDRFNKLPKTTIELARFQRTRESTEKLFTLIEGKYQEALINEQSQAGNVLIIDNARIANMPAKPNRTLIIIVGILVGFIIAMGFLLIKNYFNNTVKSPEDIEKRTSNVLAWIPKIPELNGKSEIGDDFFIEKSPSSIASEAIRALRTRVQSSKRHKSNFKSIVVTSPTPQEGKSTIALNLAGSLAHSNRMTLLIDVDLRKPRLHQTFGLEKEPGLVNYLLGKASFEQILTQTSTRNLFFIPSGSIAANPSEILESARMDDFLRKVRAEFDYVIIDSPPIVAVTDAEILTRKADAAILVVSANKTKNDVLQRGIDLLKHGHSFFIGTVLNNFSTKQGYGGYYKYYYYYSPEGEKKIRSESNEVKKEHIE